MSDRNKKVAAAMAAVIEFVRREEEARAPTAAAPPSRWAATGREQIMSGRAQVIARLCR